MTHTITGTDRLDLISYRYYGSPFLYDIILRANKAIQGLTELPGGMTIIIPDLIEPPSINDVSPGWATE